MKKFILVLLPLLTSCADDIAAPNRVNIIDGNRVEAPQPCPDWSKTNGGSNYFNTLSSNYSCATYTNFGAMVENPGDMVTGKSSLLTNGARSGLAVSQYEGGSAAPAASVPAATGQ